VETIEFALIIRGFEYILEDLGLYIYGDINFVDDFIIYMSIGGYIVFLAGCLIIWKSKK